MNIFLAGFLATIVMTILMMLAKGMGMMEKMGVKMDLPKMLGEMILGNEAAEGKVKMAGLILHLIIGSVLGGGFGYLVAKNLFFEANITSAFIFSVILWLVMMFMTLPMMGKGVFGGKLGSAKKVGMMTLMLHLVYGARLGYFLFSV